MIENGSTRAFEAMDLSRQLPLCIVGPRYLNLKTATESFKEKNRFETKCFESMLVPKPIPSYPNELVEKQSKFYHACLVLKPSS